MVRDSGRNIYSHTKPGRKAIYPPINSVLGKHINDEEAPASQRSMKRTKTSKHEGAKAPSLTPHLDPNIRSLAFSFGSEELNQIRMLPPSRRQRAAPQILANNDKENDDPEEEEKSANDDTAIAQADKMGHDSEVDKNSSHHTTGDSKEVDEEAERDVKTPSTSSHDRQLAKTPNTSKGWGFRSLWGSVSRLLPGAQTEPKITLDREDMHMSNGVDPASPTPFRASDVQLPNEQRSQKPQRGNVPSKPHVAAKGRTPVSKPRERNADKRFAQHKAAWQVKEDNRRMKNEAKARRIREAEEREQKRKTKIKIHIDELPEIPTHRPGESGAYGMLDEFFVYDSDSDNEVVELDGSQYDLGDISAGSDKPSKRAKTLQGSDAGSSEMPQFAPMPRNIEDPFIGHSNGDNEAHRAKPYVGTLFADKEDATTYKGGNVFGQSEKFSGNSTDSSSGRGNPVSPKNRRSSVNSKNVQFAKLPSSATNTKDYLAQLSSAGQTGTFCVPDDSDSDDSSSEDQNSGSSSSDKIKSSSKTIIGPKATGADAKINTTGSENSKPETTPVSSKTNIFELGMKSSQTSPSVQKQSLRQEREGRIYEDLTTEATGDGSQPQLFTQPTPPRPVPAHATLPSTASSAADSDALARARSQAEKYKPKQPSGLRASSKLSGNSSLSDAGKAMGNGTSLVPSSEIGEPAVAAGPAGSGDQLTPANDVTDTSKPVDLVAKTNMVSPFPFLFPLFLLALLLRTHKA